jgi:predicted DNA-binding protein
MADKKAMSLRLEPDQARELQAVADTDGVTIADAVRTAIDAHIRSRREDSAFRTRLRERIQENQDILERLAR